MPWPRTFPSVTTESECTTGILIDDPFDSRIALAQGHGERSRTMIAVIVITHGQFGQELLRTAQDIAGRQENVAALAVTPEMGLDSVSQELGKALERFNHPD